MFCMKHTLHVNRTTTQIVAGCCLLSLIVSGSAQKQTRKNTAQKTAKKIAPTKHTKALSKAQIQRQLALATFNSDLNAVKRALAAGADPNARSLEGRFALADAVVAHDWPIANWLRLKGASIQKVGPDILLAGAEHGDPEVLRYVFRFGIKATGLYDVDGATPLVACAGGSDNEAFIDVEDQDNFPVVGDPIADERRLQALRILLDAGLQPNQRDKNGQLPLQAAAEKGRAGLVKLLIERGAGVNNRNKRGWTPLLAATPVPANSLPHKKVREMLFSKGADVNIGDPVTGLTPWHYAVREGREDLIKEFLARGADVNAPLLNGQTPLIISMLEARVAVARTLLERGADVHRKDKAGKTALDYEKYGLGDTEAQLEIDLSNPVTREFFDEAMEGKIDKKFWADIQKRRALIASLIRQQP